MQFEKSSFQFLKDLQKNNNRDWFTEHKPTFVNIQKHVKEVFLEMQANLEKHDDIDKMKIYRIYRDVRFSKDKTPYNPRLAVSFSRLGKHLRGGYFLQIKPGETLLGGGFWQPDAPDLKRIREELAVDPDSLRKIINSASFKEHFGVLGGEQLKTAPKGYPKDQNP